MRCPHCNSLVDRSEPDKTHFRAFCFVCNKYVTINNREAPHFNGAKCAYCGKKVSFNHETEERTCCDPKKKGGTYER